ncbi:tetratricopeptide repeat protein 12 [Chanos chanos]|uniref:Tetratricopeptide repeat protein 12 n=1 Tax=Chanos chanos TaxID=29144 RepID=A0A6J2VR71_CHACN|nr:tetratricopeptide repeat protein 12 [Chanos chanos]
MEEDLEKFLKNVDQISELVKEFNTSDVKSQEKAVERADRFLASLNDEETCKTRLNRTVINNKPSHAIGSAVSIFTCFVSKENFMKFLEKDAEERRRRRKIQEVQANALKEKGNEAFAQGDYEKAVKFYTEGLQQQRDMQALYTNRAQALIKLRRYKEAISDCEWALRCNEKCIKAYVHMGRSHLALKNYSESRMCFQKILDLEPERETMVKDYLTKVDLEENKDSQEKTAWEEFEKGEEKATVMPQLLEKLDRPNEMPLYYCGGVKLLSQTITDSTGQTLFRLNNGFSIVNGNNVVRRCLSQNAGEPYSEELCVSVLKLWRVICNGNDENQQMLIRCSNTSEHLVQLLISQTEEVQLECLALLVSYSQTQLGRRLMIENLNLSTFVENLMSCISTDINLALTALTILEGLASENKFRSQSREIFTTLFVPPFESFLKNITESNQRVLPSFISVIGTMALDDVIRRKVANMKEFWEASFTAMEQCTCCEYRIVLYPLLGLMINISSNPSLAVQDYADGICSGCLNLLSDCEGGIITRAAGLLSTVLIKSQDATQNVVEKGIVKKLLRLLKGAGQTTSRYSIKTLAVCTASSQQACEELVMHDKRLQTLRKLLGSNDELVVGNAALCLGHCLAVQGAAASLLGTDIVMPLLRHAAGDTKRSAVQQNAAIALGKLCKTEPRHMVKLRELHGLEILHSCMKLIT